MAITLQDLEQALYSADQAGDTTSARLFAAEIKKIQSANAPREGNIVTGAGKRLSQIGEGLSGAGMRFGEFMGVTDPEALKRYEAGVAESRSVMSPTYRQNMPTGGAEITGSTAVDVLGSLLGGTALKAGKAIPYAGKYSEALGGALLPTTLPQATAGGALYSLTTPSESTPEMLSRAGLGGLIGGGTQFGLRQVGLAPQLPPNLTEQQQEVARRAIEQGYKLDPTQLTGYGAGIKEGIKSNLPFARGAFTRLEQSNQEQTNNIAKELIKLPASAPLTNENMRSAYNQALNNYKSLKSLPAVIGDNEFRTAINAEINKIQSLKPTLLTAEDKRALKILKDFESFPSQSMTGDQVFRSMKAIGDNLFQAKKAGSGTAIDALTTLRTSLEDSVERYLNSPSNLMRTNGADTLNKFREGRKDMSNWFLVDKAFNSETGNISSAKLANELSKKPTYGTTKEPIETAAMLGSAFPRAYPSSGTSERLASGDIYKSTTGLLASPLTYLGTSSPVRNILGQRYVGAKPEGFVGGAYGLTSKVGGFVPEKLRTGFGRALMAAEQQQLQQTLNPTYGLLGK
jgi:hypothetical protein